MEKIKGLSSESVYQKQVTLFSALSHAVRLKIVDLLSSGDMTCGGLIEYLKIPKANLTQHLNILKAARIVKSEKRGVYQNLSLNLPDILYVSAELKRVILKKKK